MQANGQNVIIRPMKLEDIDAVYQIEVKSFALPWSIRSYQFEVCDNQSSRSWVAEAHFPDGAVKIIGMTVIWLILDEAHIANFAVHPDYRSLGIGKKLIAHAILSVLENGAAQVFLEVRRHNETAQHIYSKIGFEVVGIRERYYKDTGEDALLMACTRPNIRKLKKWAQIRIPDKALTDSLERR